MTADLRWTSRPRDPRAVVLVLHGGQETSTTPAHWWNPAVLRMVPVAHNAARAGRGTAAVALLRYAVRGWNGPAASPVVDARAALDAVTERHPGVPVVLVGHSMGGRVALTLAEDERVAVVVGLAPWVVGDVGTRAHPAQRLLLVHGLDDRTTSPAASRRLVERLQERGVAAAFVGVRDGEHAMLKRAPTWDQVVRGFLATTLGTAAAPRSEPGRVGVRAGEVPLVTVV